MRQEPVQAVCTIFLKGEKKNFLTRHCSKEEKILMRSGNYCKKSDNPIQQIKLFFLHTAEADQTAHQKGCIVANTLVEMTFVDNELKEEAEKILKETEELYRNVISDEQNKGTLQTKVPADVLSKYLITFWLGINSLRRIYPDHKTLKTQIKLQLEILS